jgi:hypothetical protein
VRDDRRDAHFGRLFGTSAKITNAKYELLSSCRFSHGAFDGITVRLSSMDSLYFARIPGGNGMIFDFSVIALFPSGNLR